MLRRTPGTGRGCAQTSLEHVYPSGDIGCIVEVHLTIKVISGAVGGHQLLLMGGKFHVEVH